MKEATKGKSKREKGRRRANKRRRARFTCVIRFSASGMRRLLLLLGQSGRLLLLLLLLEAMREHGRVGGMGGRVAGLGRRRRRAGRADLASRAVATTGARSERRLTPARAQRAAQLDPRRHGRPLSVAGSLPGSRLRRLTRTERALVVRRLARRRRI